MSIPPLLKPSPYSSQQDDGNQVYVGWSNLQEMEVNEEYRRLDYADKKERMRKAEEAHRKKMVIEKAVGVVGGEGEGEKEGRGNASPDFKEKVVGYGDVENEEIGGEGGGKEKGERKGKGKGKKKAGEKRTNWLKRLIAKI